MLPVAHSGWGIIQYARHLCTKNHPSNLLIGLLAFGMAWVVFEFFAVYNLEVVARAAPKDRLINRIFGRKKQHDKRRGTRFMVGRVWRVAHAWREFHFSAGGWFTVFAKFVFYGSVPFVTYYIAIQLGLPRTDPPRFIGSAFMIIGATVALGEAAFLFGSSVWTGCL